MRDGYVRGLQLRVRLHERPERLEMSVRYKRQEGKLISMSIATGWDGVDTDHWRSGYEHSSREDKSDDRLELHSDSRGSE